ncbi:maleylpyruvate isomerase family mycothiol-dependent enzyme [Catellatospora tritici]|uniref:maleylpyruvate isomerase family mycothiol-dependent enzyme n=1 Tax=Catellatospora tritici TaxID=2851566 RepID=UPI001C2CF2EA|nr:maleylpyruvate isomerase family mycothiol-dependent enzyme [Catellatospora tritici]MBV1853255.1 maleylpyruvate isomerase family mycothiol-dependent enzyme [Catellatospora tritici]
MSSLERAAKACRHTLDSLVALGAELTDAQWDAATDLPLWTVGDVYAHVVAGEKWMAEGGLPLPPGPPQAWIDQGVAQRRGAGRAAVLAELAEVRAQRELQLTSGLPPADAIGWWIWSHSPVPFVVQLTARAFDLWTHEQDVRRAIRRPGGLASPGARISRDLILQALPKVVAKGAGVPAGSTVRFTVMGEVPTDFAVHVDDQGRAAVAAADTHSSTTHITLTWQGFALLSTGRGDRGRQQVWVGGDTELGERVLAHLNVAP